MSKRTYGIPVLALSLTSAASCGDKQEDDDDDWDDVPLLGEAGTTDGSDGSDGMSGTDGGGTGAHAGDDTLLGHWSLTEVDGRPWGGEYSYTYAGCTYTYAYVIDFDFIEQEGSTFIGSLTQGNTYTVSGDCESGGYSYTYANDAVGTQDAERQYDIRVLDMGLLFDCELDASNLDALDCDYYGYNYRWER